MLKLRPGQTIRALSRLTAVLAICAIFTGWQSIANAPGANAQSENELQWMTDYQASLGKASGAGKLVLVDFYTDWCGWCKKLDRDTYTNPAVVDYVNSKFVCLKLDAEDGATGQELSRKYRVRGFPCLMVLESSGKFKGVFYGYREPGPFVEELQKILKKDSKALSIR